MKMKRKPRPKNTNKPYKIKPINSWFFWNTCEICGLEFRREPGWKITGRWFTKKRQGLNGNTLNVECHAIAKFYFCANCLKTIEPDEVEVYWINNYERNL